MGFCVCRRSYLICPPTYVIVAFEANHYYTTITYPEIAVYVGLIVQHMIRIAVVVECTAPNFFPLFSPCFRAEIPEDALSK